MIQFVDLDIVARGGGGGSGGGGGGDIVTLAVMGAILAVWR